MSHPFSNSFFNIFNTYRGFFYRVFLKCGRQEVIIPIEVWAYGSRVKGSAHEGSDLDLVVRSRDLKPLPADVFININEKIKNSNIPILVELRDWAMLPESFHRNIEQQYEVLFSN